MLNDTTNCPNCKKKREAELKKRIDDVVKRRSKAYGKATERQYQDLIEEERLIREEKVSSPISFQEKWDIGLEGSHLEISYDGKCHICQFSVHFHCLPMDVLTMQQNTKLSLVEGQTELLIIDPFEVDKK